MLIKLISFLHRNLLVLAVASIGVAITWLAASFYTYHNDEEAHTNFVWAANERFLTVKNGIEARVQSLEDIASLYAASEYVSREEFRAFTQPILARQSGTQALEWVPRISLEQRSEFELKIKESIADFRITERHETGRMVPVKERENYFPVLYVEPSLGNEKALGFDLGSEPSRYDALLRAWETSVPTASDPVVLIQDKGDGVAILIFYPIYLNGKPRITPEQRQKNLHGFVLGVYLVPQLIKATVSHLTPRGIDFMIYDTASTHVVENSYLYFHSSRKFPEIKRELSLWSHSTEPFFLEKKFEVAGRLWSFQARMHPNALIDGTHMSPWFIIGGGFLITILLTYQFVQLREHIHERNRAIVQLKESDTRFRSITESASDAIIAADHEGKITFWNHGAQELFGYSESEALANSILMLMPEEFRYAHVKGFNRVLSTGQSTLSGQVIELQGLKKNGTTFPLEASLSSWQVVGHQFFAAIMRDISERKQIEQAIREKDAKAMAAEMANQAKGEFVANMSHEIRTPMNAVIGLTDLALQTKLKPKTKDYLTKIANSSRSLLRIINDILDFSKLEAGRLELESVNFLLRDVFDHLSDLFRATSAEKNVELIMGMSAECRYGLIGDYLRVEQVLMNLISNALKFTEQGIIEVWVETLKQDTEQIILEFSVKDTGIGMTEEQVKRLFQAFSQADGSTTRKYGGTGLGLSISKHLVEMMGGTISVKSTINQGSLFSFSIPFARQPDTGQDDLAPPGEMAGLRVLIVDNTAASRKAIQEFLRLFTFVTEEAESIQGALTAIRQGVVNQSPIKLVLLDWRSVDGDGCLIAQKIRETALQSGQGAFVPKVVLLTPYGREMEFCVDPYEGGVDAVLSKPVNCSQLFDTIMETFGKDVAKVYRTGLTKVDLKDIYKKIGGAQALLVEDNTINQQVAKEMMEDVGLQVAIADHGSQALQMVTKEPYDVVLMDLQMPVMDGYAATRHLRSDPAFQKLPIIAMTAHAMAGDREKCLAVGMNDHITKPINRKTLYMSLKKWIRPRPGIGAGAKLPPALQKQDGQAQDNEYIFPNSLPGLDLRSGLDRLGVNKKLYWSLLIEFQRDFSSVGDKIQEALNGRREDDYISAKQLVHTVKGLAGNLSAMELYDAALTLEQDILHKQQYMWPARLTQLQVNLEQVMNSIDALRQMQHTKPNQQPDKKIATSSFFQDTEQHLSLLQELIKLLEQQNFKAQEVYDKLLPLFSAAPEDIKSKMSELEKQLDRFAFPEAIQEAENLVKCLQTGKKDKEE